MTKEQIPSELLNASGSGLDPHISPEADYVQSKRVAAIRGVSEVEIKTLIEQHIERPLVVYSEQQKSMYSNSILRWTN